MIEHQCPQCGAPVHLEEADRLIQCAYCRVKSYLMPGDYFRYLIPAKPGNEADLIYFPYWRYRAMVFSCIMGGIEEGFIDLSQQAVTSRRFPISAGIRTQTLKLRFPDPDDPGRFIRPRLSLGEMRETIFHRNLRNAPSHIYYKAHIGETLGLIYAPFRMEDHLLDAVTDLPVPTGDPVETLPETEPFSRLNWRVRFVPALCPNCGWDLEGERDALVLICTHCRSAWSPSEGKLTKLETCHVISEDPRAVYFPFWRISAVVEGVPLETYGDLIRAAKLPKLINLQETKRPFRFWTPAFKVAPKAFLRLAENLTLSQPDFPIHRETPPGSAFTANFTPKAAAESLKITLAGLLWPWEEFFPILEGISVTARRMLLVYIPFMEGHHEWIHPTLPITLHKSVMRMAVHL